MRASHAVASPWGLGGLGCAYLQHTVLHAASIRPLRQEALTFWRASPEVASAPWVNREPCGRTRTAASPAGSADVAGRASILLRALPWVAEAAGIVPGVLLNAARHGCRPRRFRRLRRRRPPVPGLLLPRNAGALGAGGGGRRRCARSETRRPSCATLRAHVPWAGVPPCWPETLGGHVPIKQTDCAGRDSRQACPGRSRASGDQLARPPPSALGARPGPGRTDWQRPFTLAHSSVNLADDGVWPGALGSKEQ